jgi:hypothetical protein
MKEFIQLKLNSHSYFEKKAPDFSEAFLVADNLEKSNAIIDDSYKIVCVNKNVRNILFGTVIEAFWVLQFGRLVCLVFQ